jgi:hypothetical protein
LAVSSSLSRLIGGLRSANPPYALRLNASSNMTGRHGEPNNCRLVPPFNERKMKMNEAVLILPNMRGGCATVGNTVHTLFRVTSRRPRPMAGADDKAVNVACGLDEKLPTST